ncbi:MAG: hypothetical protein AAFR12_18880 [Cyanobacteria bacterium J06626_6]
MTTTPKPKTKTETQTKPKLEPFTLELPALSRHAIDELYHFLQYLQFKHEIDLGPAIEAIEDEIDPYDVEIALQEPGEPVAWEDLKKELGLS